MDISSRWTETERLHAIFLLAAQIRHSVRTNPHVPNEIRQMVEAVLHLAHAQPADIESSRAWIMFLLGGHYHDVT